MSSPISSGCPQFLLRLFILSMQNYRMLLSLSNASFLVPPVSNSSRHSTPSPLLFLLFQCSKLRFLPLSFIHTPSSHPRRSHCYPHTLLTSLPITSPSPGLHFYFFIF